MNGSVRTLLEIKIHRIYVLSRIPTDLQIQPADAAHARHRDLFGSVKITEHTSEVLQRGLVIVACLSHG